jgi:integrase
MAATVTIEPLPEGVEQLPSGKWSYRLRNEHGKRFRRTGFKTAKAAERARILEAEEIRKYKTGEAKRPVDAAAMPTFEELCVEYLQQYEAEANTRRTFEQRLRYSREKYGSLRIDNIDPESILRWHRSLPPGTAKAIVVAMGQVLRYGVRTKRLESNPVSEVVPRLRKPPAPEVVPFTMDELAAIDDELPKHLRGLATFAALTALRPSEWIALERADIDRERMVIHIRRTFRDGELRPHGKTEGSIRDVPLPRQALAILDARPARLDTRLVWPGARGGHLNLNDFRRTWAAALKAAGITHRHIYSCRHTGISIMLASGVSIFEVARLCGTSATMIERTYGRFLHDAHDRARTKVDTFLDGQQAVGELS